MRIAKTSDSPLIPNFEILGRIGGGAYGEGYLGRSVTGMYRAIKVVSREDFEYERTFEREFEGIQRYEKVSQNHPALVDVLHVGRDDEAGHYYYVMELADEEGGEHHEVNVETYKPRTLSSDLRRKSTRSVRECVDLGMAMAGGLGHLHHAGLTHRDVKPSNIIFVKGQPKLADVGLVASTGQRTFVGTEGYVPPEGPGTSSADLYSLAMVLYEMHTGKDRLDFPELPTNLEIPPTVNRDEWRALNGVICRAGSPDPRKRYESAHAFAKALQGVCADLNQVNRRKKRPLVAAMVTLAIFGMLSVAGYGGYWLWKDNQSFVGQYGTTLPSDKELSGNDGQVVRPPIGPIGQVGPIKEVVINPDGNSGAGPDSVKPAGGGDKFSLIDSPSGTVDGKGEVVIRDEVAGKKPGDQAGDLKETVVEAGKPPTGPTLVANPLENTVGQVKIMSQPSAASVWHAGEQIGITETRLLEFKRGPIELTLKSPGYHDFIYKGEVKEGTQVINATMLPDLGPIPGNPWMNSLGMEFVPEPGGGYISSGEVTVAVFDIFLDETGKEIARSAIGGIAQVPEDSALWEFCDWMTETDRATGHLGPKRYYRPRRNAGGAGNNAFFCSIEEGFGTLVLNTDPPGAAVFRGEVYLGETPAVINDLRLGEFSLQLFKEGYKVDVAMGDLSKVEAQDLIVELERDASVVFGQSWANSQGMGLVPFENLLVASCETSVLAYQEFVAEVSGTPPVAPKPGSGLNHPASGVSYAEATAFCEWLTARERAANWIRPWQRYRLPSDLEWSRFAGLPGETGETPEARNHPREVAFPWGGAWPPPPGAGNFADAAAKPFFGTNVIEGYTDGFERTAPSGSFTASSVGLFDLAGNVWEWVQDPYTDGSDGLYVVRGGGWNSSEREVLASSYRNPVPVTAKEDFYGFRYLLEDLGAPSTPGTTVLGSSE